MISKVPAVMTSVVEDLLQPQTPKVNCLSRKNLKKKQGGPAFQVETVEGPLNKPITPQDPSHTLKPSIVSNKRVAQVEELPLDQTLKPSIIIPDRLRDSKPENDQPLGAPYTDSSGCLKALTGLVDSIDRPIEAERGGPSNTNNRGLHTMARHSPDHNPDNSFTTRTLNYLHSL